MLILQCFVDLLVCASGSQSKYISHIREDVRLALTEGLDRFGIFHEMFLRFDNAIVMS